MGESSEVVRGCSEDGGVREEIDVREMWSVIRIGHEIQVGC